MKEFKSDSVLINKSASEVFAFLADFDNMGRLMPEQVVNWTSDSVSCRFTIKGLADIGLKFGEKIPNEWVQMVTDGKVPFNFDLNTFIQSNGDSSEVHICLNANLNPMFSMMASKPLQNFVNILIYKLKEEMEA
ncbi:MAG: SRPBCC family protein [Bacteroidales bacterium]|nr:SRPBCC family protein [Bacteroidales bacterium]